MEVLLILAQFYAPFAPRAEEPKKVPETKIEKKAEVIESYELGRSRADKAKLPLVVYVRCAEQKIDGMLSIRTDHFPGVDGPAVVIYVGGNWYKMNSQETEDIVYEVNRRMRREASLPAAPFSENAGPDDDIKAIGRWPTMYRLFGMTRFSPTKSTQSIFTYVGNPNGIIRSEPRTGLEAKYNVPGGLVGVHGWKSLLFKHVPEGGKQWFGRTPVQNSFGHFQHELAFLREYPDGTEFDDVLVNTETGKVFEHRIATKNDGKWERFIAWQDKTQRPAGYVPPKSKECRSCHLEAGSGKYGVGLVPGGDTVISDPFADFPRIGEEKQVR